MLYWWHSIPLLVLSVDPNIYPYFKPDKEIFFSPNMIFPNVQTKLHRVFILHIFHQREKSAKSASFCDVDFSPFFHTPLRVVLAIWSTGYKWKWKVKSNLCEFPLMENVPRTKCDWKPLKILDTFRFQNRFAWQKFSSWDRCMDAILDKTTNVNRVSLWPNCRIKPDWWHIGWVLSISWSPKVKVWIMMTLDNKIKIDWKQALANCCNFDIDWFCILINLKQSS